MAVLSANLFSLVVLGLTASSSANRQQLRVAGKNGTENLTKTAPVVEKHVTVVATAKASMKNVSAHSAFLQEDGGADPCKCVFKGVCNCEASIEFMTCISTACQSGKCACGGNHHFVQACNDMSSACPTVGLKCEAKQAQCMGEKVPLMAVEEEKKAPVAAPVKVAEKAPAAVEEAVLIPTGELSFKQKLWAFVVHAFFMLFIAFLYDKYRHRELAFPQSPVISDAPGFQYHLFGCLADWRTTLMTVCCWQLRWSDTVDKANLGRYWQMVVVWILFTSVYDVHLGGFCGFVLLCVATHYRQQLRKACEAKTGGITILGDFCVYSWCGCCAIIQEARQVESMQDGYGK